MLIDTHCHLDKDDYDDLNKVIENMESNIMIASGTNLNTSINVVNLCNEYDNIYGTIGFHPSELENYNNKSLNELESYLKNKKIVGIGEIGLDYHYGKDDIEIQKKAFIEQLELARKYNLPVVIHSRDSAYDTLEIIKNYQDLKISMHCYSYSLEIAKELVKMGFKIGIGGVLTFKNSVKLLEIVKEIDIHNILIETDSPYLTPEPYRGHKNEPLNVKYVVKKIAEIKNITEEEVAKITTENAISQFDLDLKK